MVVFDGVVYKSKAEVVRELFKSGALRNEPQDKNRIARLLGVAPQTVHATIVSYLNGGARKPVSRHTTDNFKSVREAINKAFDKCYEVAYSRAKNLPKIDIKWDLKGTTAGQFRVRNYRPHFRVNLQLASENLEDYINQTIPHEFCHYLVWNDDRLNGLFRSRPHGGEWKFYMTVWFNRVPKVTHNYDVSNACRGRRFEYKCVCSTHWLSAIKHRRAQKGLPYTCKKCRTVVKFQG